MGESSVKMNKLMTPYVTSARLISCQFRCSDATIESWTMTAITPGMMKYNTTWIAWIVNKFIPRFFSTYSIHTVEYYRYYIRTDASGQSHLPKVLRLDLMGGKRETGKIRE